MVATVLVLETNSEKNICLLYCLLFIENERGYRKKGG